MNRRDLLKQFAAVPVAAAVALPAIAEEAFDTATTTASVTYGSSGPLGFTCAKGHPFCNCSGDVLTEKSLEDMCRKLQELEASGVPIRTKMVADHEFHSDRAICRYCGATELEVEEGRRPWCWIRSVPA